MFDLSYTDSLDNVVDYWDAWFPGRSLVLVGEAIQEDARLRLEDDETGPSGQKWKPWSPAYAETRGPGDKLLYDTGALSRSIDSVLRGDVLEVGSELPYATAQQFGSRDGNLEARPYIGLSRELEAAFEGMFQADFDRGWTAVQ